MRRWMVVLLAVLAGSGCTSLSKQEAAGPAPTLADEVGQLERRLEDARRRQQQTADELRAVRAEMMSAVQGLREIKARADAASAAMASNQTQVATLDEQVRKARARADEAAAVERLQADLQREREQRERGQVVAAEREKEIRALRDALEERDRLLKKNRRQGPAEPTMPPPAAAPARPAQPQAEAKPAKPPAPAPAPAPAAKSATGSVYRLIADGNTALKRSDLAQATALFQAALAQDPALVGARLGLAACAYQTDNIKEARRLVDEVLGEDGQNAQALGLRGILRWREGFLADAVEDCAEAVERSPDDPMLRKFYGIVLHARKKPDEALRQMRKAVELDPGDAEAKLNLAILLATARKPQVDEARKLYDEAVAAGAARDAALERLLDAGAAKP